MPAQFLIRSWKKELQVFYRNLSILQNNLDQEAIHDLRVSIKKLRSYYRLYVNILAKDKDAVFSLATKKLFSVLGRQRNIEISIELFQKLNGEKKISELEKHFKLFLEETKQSSRSVLKHYAPVELRKSTLEIEKNSSQLEDEKIKRDLLRLFKNSIADVKKHLKDFSENYHIARKKLKDIFYWNEILPENFYFKKQELKSLKTILDHLGDAQDLVVLRSNLKYFRKTFLAKGEEEYRSLHQFEEKIIAKRENYLEKAEEEIRKLFSAHKKTDLQRSV